MKVLIRKDSSDIRNRLERLGYTASEKALEGFGDGIFVDKSDNTFHVKSEWNVIYMFLETVDCGDDENMFFDFVENDITSIMPMMLGKYKSLIKIGDFPVINTSSSELLTPKGMSFFLLLPAIAFYDSPQALLSHAPWVGLLSQKNV